MRTTFTLFIICVSCFTSCQKKKIETAEIKSINQPAQNVPLPVIGLEIGNKAPDLYLKDSNNVFTQLSSVKSKLVLVDFWASWCAPCKIENLNLKTVYAEYKDTTFKSGKGFEIYSVSTENNRYYWRKCIAQYGYNWKYNLIDSADWNKTGSYLYNVTSIPTNFLLDSNGIIIAKNLRDTMVEKH